MICNCYSKIKPSAGSFALNFVVEMLFSPIVGLAILIGSIISLIVVTINFTHRLLKKYFKCYAEEKSILLSVRTLHEKSVEADIKKIRSTSKNQDQESLSQEIAAYQNSQDLLLVKKMDECKKNLKEREYVRIYSAQSAIGLLFKRGCKAFAHMFVVTYPLQVIRNLYQQQLLGVSGHWKEKIEALKLF